MCRFFICLRIWLTVAAALLAIAAAPPTPPADEIRRQADAVFDRPEFKTGGPTRASWFVRQLLDFFAWLGRLREISPILYWVMLIGCLVALAALITLIVFQLRSVFVVGSQRAIDELGEARRLHLSASHRAEADDCAAAGDYTEAARHLFLSLVYRFDERGRVSFQKAYTNREYLDLLRDRPAVRDALQIFVDLLDDHWYGQKPCDRPQYETCLEVYQRLAT